MDVIAHEIELVLTAFLNRVGRQLRGRQSEDQPAIASINRRELEHISEERPIPLCVRSKDHCMHSGDHVRLTWTVLQPQRVLPLDRSCCCEASSFAEVRVIATL